MPINLFRFVYQDKKHCYQLTLPSQAKLLKVEDEKVLSPVVGTIILSNLAYPIFSTCQLFLLTNTFIASIYRQHKIAIAEKNLGEFEKRINDERYLKKLSSKFDGSLRRSSRVFFHNLRNTNALFEELLTKEQSSCKPNSSTPPVTPRSSEIPTDIELLQKYFSVLPDHNSFPKHWLAKANKRNFTLEESHPLREALGFDKLFHEQKHVIDSKNDFYSPGSLGKSIRTPMTSLLESRFKAAYLYNIKDSLSVDRRNLDIYRSHLQAQLLTHRIQYGYVKIDLIFHFLNLIPIIGHYIAKNWKEDLLNDRLNRDVRIYGMDRSNQQASEASPDKKEETEINKSILQKYNEIMASIDPAIYYQFSNESSASSDKTISYKQFYSCKSTVAAEFQNFMDYLCGTKKSPFLKKD